MITVTISGATPEEFGANFKVIAASQGYVSVKELQNAVQAQKNAVPANTPESKPAATEQKPEKPKRAANKSIGEVPADQPRTHDDCRAMIRTILETDGKGEPTAKAICEEFGIPSVKHLKPDQLNGFYNRCLREFAA